MTAYNNEEKIEMTTEDAQQKIEELQKVADYLTVKKKLRWGAIGSIIFGALILLGFVSYPSADLVNLIFLAVGLFIFIEGIWLLVDPKPTGLIIEGIILLALGIWNIVWTVVEINQTGTSVRINLVPIFQVAWGIGMIAQYPRFKNASAAGASEKLIAELKRIVKEVLKSNPRTAHNIIEFKSKTFLRMLKWKGRLSEPFAIFAEKKGYDVLFLRKQEINFEPKKKVRPGKSVEVRTHLGPRKLDAKIAAEHFERFEAWKNAG